MNGFSIRREDKTKPNPYIYLINYDQPLKNNFKKGYIHKQIDKKQDEIGQIEHNDFLKYGLDGRSPHVITKEDEKKERLQNKIIELERNFRESGTNGFTCRTVGLNLLFHLQLHTQ